MGKKTAKRANVHVAMAEERPEKAAVRKIWAEQVKKFFPPEEGSTVPLYLTLSGALGLDIKRLVDEGFVQLNPNGSIADDSSNVVVAIERNAHAILEIKRRFPGLKVRETHLGELFRGESPFRFPDGSDRTICRSRVVNLDLDQVLKEASVKPEFDFPVIRWVEKLGLLHKEDPALDWCLCLTLHGETPWDNDLSGRVLTYLTDNFDFDTDFEAACRSNVGDDIIDEIRNGALKPAEQPVSVQQQLLCMFVPKMIADRLRAQGWHITTDYNLAYGGTRHRAPMYTCVLSFRVSQVAATSPHENYRSALRSIMSKFGIIDANGNIECGG
ncbi:MAG: hypothetical protein O3C40_33110 [Planctomycetota bacterium]|nr:hypothetical protein [Planctomycetota bacterium]